MSCNKRSRRDSLAGVALAACVVLGTACIPVAGGEEAPPVPFTVMVRYMGSPGNILAAGNGWSLYTFDRDPIGASTCVDDCARTWPPLILSSGDPAGSPDLPGVLAVITRPDGRRQVTHNGRPLYYYSGDRQQGDMNGDGVGSVWHVARPSIAGANQASRAAATTTIVADGSTAWNPPGGGVAPGGTVVWENRDPNSAHSVECVQSQSSDTCPWTEVLSLPVPGRDAAGNLAPTSVSVTFPRPGIYAFRCTVHPEMTGEIDVGAP